MYHDGSLLSRQSSVFVVTHIKTGLADPPDWFCRRKEVLVLQIHKRACSYGGHFHVNNVLEEILLMHNCVVQHHNIDLIPIRWSICLDRTALCFMPTWIVDPPM